MWGRRFPPGWQSPGLGYSRHERVFQPHSPLLEDRRSFWTPSSSFRPFFSQLGPPACPVLNAPTWIWYFKKGSWGKFPSCPVVGTPCFDCQGCNSILGQGDKILTSFAMGPKEKKKKGSWALSNQRPWFPSPLGLKGQTRSLPVGLCWPQSVRGTDSGLLPRVSWGWRWRGCGQSARSPFPRLLRPEFLGRFTKMQDLVFVMNP